MVTIPIWLFVLLLAFTAIGLVLLGAVFVFWGSDDTDHH